MREFPYLPALWCLGPAATAGGMKARDVLKFCGGRKGIGEGKRADCLARQQWLVGELGAAFAIMAVGCAAMASAATTKPLPVEPLLDYVIDLPGGGYSAVFGYRNENAVSVAIPVGTKNKFAPKPQDRGQPVNFSPGLRSEVFSVQFASGTLTWNLDGRSAYATPNRRPVVQITAPVDGLTVSAPASIEILANAYDPDATGSVKRVEFYRDGVLVGTDASAPYQLTLADVPPGAYRFHVCAFDDRNAPSLDSAAVTVTVSAAGPAVVPFQAGFEKEDGYQEGPLDAQGGWLASEATVVNATDAVEGLQSVLLGGGVPAEYMKRDIESAPGQRVVYADYFGLPFAAATEGESAIFSLEGLTHVAFVAAAGSGGFSAWDGDGLGGGRWRPTRTGVALDGDGYAQEWTRLTVRVDFGVGRWDLYVDGRLSAVDLGIDRAQQQGLASFIAMGSPSGATLIDGLLVADQNPVFADEDQDGMADAWETTHGLDQHVMDRQGDPDADGLPNVLEFMLGSDPTRPDSDGDGMPDLWEFYHGLNPAALDADADLDGDGVGNLAEYLSGRDPRRGAILDHDGVVNLRVLRPSE